MAFPWIEPLLSVEQSFDHIEVFLCAEQFCDVLGFENLVARSLVLMW